MTEVVIPGSEARIAAAEEAIGFDELALAARNNGVLLEALRHDVTPVGACTIC